MAKATYNGLKKYSHKRPYVITGQLMRERKSIQPSGQGDNQSLWPHLQMMIPQLCNLGMSGFTFAGTDIGGFGADATAEMLTRWIEAALFNPLYRNHASMGTRAQEPWVFGEPTLSIYRKYLKVKISFHSIFIRSLLQGNKEWARNNASVSIKLRSRPCCSDNER